MNWYEVLPNVLNMSLTGSVIILVVMLIRLVLRKAPKIYSYVLWSVVLFRLLCPFSFSAPFSILGVLDAPVVEQAGIEQTGRVEYVPSDIVHTAYPEVNLPISVLDDAINETLPQGKEQVVADPLEAPVSLVTYLWMTGIIVLLGSSVISYVRLRQKLVGALKYRDNIYRVDHITTPFVLGIVRPRIYLPSDVSEDEREYIILHEKHHIRRLDPLFKALAFAALCIHWFNPLVWAAFILASRDMEMSCDEAVIKKLGDGVKAGYSASLLQLSAGEKVFMGVPVAFGETSVSGRIRNLARFRKPSVIAGVAAALLCIAGILICIFNPAVSKDSLQVVQIGTPAGDNQVRYEISLGQQVMSGNIFVEQWVNGTCVPSAPVALTRYVEEIQILIGERRDEGQIIGMDVQVETDEYGGSLLTYTPFSGGNSAIGWSFTAHEEKETIEIVPGEEVILAAMAFDMGEGVRVFDCETLAAEPERLENADRMIVIRAVFSEKVVEPSAVEQAVATVVEQLEPVEVLQLQDVIRLAEKGADLSWKDFEQYAYTETGSGLYIRVYEIAEMTENGTAEQGKWRLWIGGAGPESEPMYMYLTYGEEDSGFIDEWEGRIDIREEDVEAFILEQEDAEAQDKEEDKEDKEDKDKDEEEQKEEQIDAGKLFEDAEQKEALEEAIHTAILDYHAPSEPDGLFHCESHIILGTREVSGTSQSEGNSGKNLLTVYAMVLEQAYGYSGGTFHDQGGSHLPTAITFEVTADGRYVLQEYWIPSDGSYYLPSIREKFPFSIEAEAIDTQKYIMEQIQNCYDQAVRYGNVDTDTVIEGLFDTMLSSDAAPDSDVASYMEKHSLIFRELRYFGDYTLRYCFGEFIKGGQTGLKGQLMAAACRNIMVGYGEALFTDKMPATGQEGFDIYRANAEALRMRYTEEEIETLYPAAWVLLTMISE